MEYHSRRAEGQGLVEYAMILLLIAVAVVAVVILLGPLIGNLYSRMVLEFPS